MENTENIGKQRGGKRQGAGRKLTENGKKVAKDVSLYPKTVGTLSQFGDGKLSVGIERAATIVEEALTDDVVDILTEYGDGDLLEGIRRAADLANIKMLVG